MEETINEVVEESRPKMTDLGWTDWAIAQLDPTEMDQECHPKVDGLRRLAELYLGEIIVSETKIVSVMPEKTTAEYTIEFNYKTDREGYPLTKRYTSAADCGPCNCNEKFAVYAAAMAETRAEARALRKALRLKIVSAEELNGPDIKERPTKKDLATDTQIAVLQLKAKQLKIDLDKFIQLDNFGEEKYKDVKLVPTTKAAEMLKYISNVQNGKEKLPETCYIK